MYKIESMPKELQYKAKRLSDMEHRIMAFIDEVLPECWQREQAKLKFYEGLMWSGSSLNTLTKFDEEETQG